MVNIIFHNEIGNTAYDADEKIIYYRHAGIVKTNLIIEHLIFAQQFSKKNPVRAAIADITHLRGSFRSMFDYFKNKHYPIMSQHGQLCSAILVSDDLITHFLSEEMRDLSKDVTVRNFLSMNEAESWVKKTISQEAIMKSKPNKRS